MKSVSYHYVIYIASTQRKVWKALFDPAQTRQYWQHENRSDWKPGSRWEHVRNDAAETLDLVGRVVRFEPNRILVITWACPEDEKRKSEHSKVTLEVEPYRRITRLTVTHEGLKPASEMLEGITEGWPMVLSSLKSLLETGKPLPVLW